MKISVITITYNAAATLEQTILSVLEQDHQQVEYIVVDGGSTDDTRKIIDKYRDRISKVISEPDNGLYDAINKGIGLATGDVIALLHSDDFYCHSSVLSEYARTFQRTNCDAVYADLYYVDRSDTNKIVRKWKSGPYHEGDFLKGWMPPHPTFLCKRELFSKFGAYRNDFRTAADYELMLRFIHRFKISVAYLPVFVIRMRVGGESNRTWKNRLLANADDRRAWKVNHLMPGWLTLWLKPLRKLSQFF